MFVYHLPLISRNVSSTERISKGESGYIHNKENAETRTISGKVNYSISVRFRNDNSVMGTF